MDLRRRFICKTELDTNGKAIDFTIIAIDFCDLICCVLCMGKFLKNPIAKVLDIVSNQK